MHVVAVANFHFPLSVQVRFISPNSRGWCVYSNSDTDRLCRQDFKLQVELPWLSLVMGHDHVVDRHHAV